MTAKAPGVGKVPWFLTVSLGAAGGTLSPASRFPVLSGLLVIEAERATSYSRIGAVWVSGDGAGLFGEVHNT